MLRADLSSVQDPLTGWFWKGVLEKEFYGIQLTTFSGMNNFGHIQVRKVIFFEKCSKFYVDFENQIKVLENDDGFEDNFLWTCCGSFCQLWQQYMWWAVNVLGSGPKLSDLTKRNAAQLIFVVLMEHYHKTAVVGTWAVFWTP